MDNKRRPRRRETHVDHSVQGNVHRRGSGLNSGPVGPGGSGPKRSGTRGGFGGILVILLMLLMGGGVSLSSLFGGAPSTGGGSGQSQYSYQTSNTYGQWTDSNVAKLDTTVAKGSRAKRTKLMGDGQDTVTIMVYMCGTDLESRSRMATSDLQEMLAATIGDNVNLLVYTGGCARWNNNVVSSSVNQIYQIKDGKMARVVADDGRKSMTDPTTLTSFIKWCAKNYKANRYELILWDHGGGSISGFGYDEKYRSSGSMDLSEINQALDNANVNFDFIGFDACLMGTVETASMLANYADYLIGSEETEPGIGWYYTDWLTKLSNNTSMKTLDIGKQICDDFVTKCGSRCPGQKTTLALVDLAELQNTVPDKLNAFAKSISTKIKAKEYSTVSQARNQCRTFATSQRIDQVDLVDLADKMNTEEGKALSEAVKGAVKYNRTSSNMTNSYGLSIFFPYDRISSVDTVVDTYSKIGMDEEYAKCIQEFASVEAGGQAYSSQSGSSQNLLNLLGGSQQSTSNSDSEAMMELLNLFLGGGNYSSVNGLNSSNTNFLSGRSITNEEITDFVDKHHIDDSQLTWKEEDGTYKLSLTEEQWEMVQTVDQSLYYDDGTGYVDLGLDNNYDFDDEGNLIAVTDRTWLSINGRVVAYYHTDTQEDGDNYTITGYVPALLNGTRVNLILVFTNENPDGIIAGATTDYIDGETETVAKSLTQLEEGDTLEFVCDYYTYDGEYENSYLLDEPLTVTKDMKIRNIDVGKGKVKIVYRFTDTYNQTHYSEAIMK